MKDVLEKIASYQRATQRLLDYIEAYEHVVKTHVPFELWGWFDLKLFKTNVYENHHVSINGKPVPFKTENLGKGDYWHGDLNSYYTYVTGTELIKWANKLPGLVDTVKVLVNQKTAEAEKLNNELKDKL